MPGDATLEEVWSLFRETSRQLQESDRQRQDTDRQIQATDRQLQETDRQLQEAVRAMREGRAATDKQFAETDRKLRELSEEVTRTTRAVGDLTGKWGKFVEGVVAPACETLFAEWGIPVHRVFQRARVRVGGRSMEIDILVLNDRHVVLVEVKSTLKIQDVRDHMQRLAEFKAFFPEYTGHRVLGAVAGMVIEEDADRFAYREGLFVLAQSGETVRVLNDGTFRPKAW